MRVSTFGRWPAEYMGARLTPGSGWRLRAGYLSPLGGGPALGPVVRHILGSPAGEGPGSGAGRDVDGAGTGGPPEAIHASTRSSTI